MAKRSLSYFTSRSPSGGETQALRQNSKNRPRHEFDTRQSTNFAKWLHYVSIYGQYIVKLPPPPTLPVHPVLVLYFATVRVGMSIYRSVFKTAVCHATIRLKTKLFLSFKVNFSQLFKILMHMYQNKYQSEQMLIIISWPKFLCCLLVYHVVICHLSANNLKFYVGAIK
jgi:hypothetical protein